MIVKVTLALLFCSALMAVGAGVGFLKWNQHIGQAQAASIIPDGGGNR